MHHLAFNSSNGVCTVVVVEDDAIFAASSPVAIITYIETQV